MEFFIPGPAYPKHKVGNRKDEAEKWSESIISCTKDLPKVGGPCRMRINFQLPQDRFTLGSPYGSDLDNLTKRLLDSLSSTILEDEDSKDGCICKIEISKRAAANSETIGTHVVIDPIYELEKNERFLYFAYGSNMHYARLKDRAKSLERRSVAYLPEYRLRTNKISKDGSGKANIERSQSSSDLVWGVVWSIARSDRSELDKAEGYRPNTHESDYKPIEVIVFDQDGTPWKVLTYVACAGRTSSNDLPLYKWYYDYLINGARGHHLPQKHQDLIRQFKYMEDPDSRRNGENYEIVNKWPDG